MDNEILAELKELNNSMKENNKLLNEILNFFYAIEERETGQPSVNSQGYLNELEKDGFRPSGG